MFEILRKPKTTPTNSGGVQRVVQGRNNGSQSQYRGSNTQRFSNQSRPVQPVQNRVVPSQTYNNSSQPIKIIPISGVEQIGANCTAIQYGNDIIVVDAGLGFPDESNLGIDLLIPNPKFLEDNKGKIKALFITHGHLDHIGGIPYLIESMGFPDIYVSDFARGLIEINIQKYHSDIYPKINFVKVDTQSNIRLGNFKISLFCKKF